MPQSTLYRDLSDLDTGKTYHFTGETPYYEMTALFTRTNGSADLNQFGLAASVASAFFTVPRTGIISAASFVALTGLAANDTNFHTFTLTNLGSANGASIVLLATTPAGVNTTKATGGTAITALVPYTLTLSGTATTLAVNEGDVLQLTATATGTPAATVDAPMARIRVQTFPGDLKPRIVRTVGNPSIKHVANTANGEVICTLDATSEAQVAGMDHGDQLLIPGTTGAYFEALVKMSTLAASQRVVVGLGTAFNSTLTSRSRYVQCRIENGTNVLIDSADGVTTNTGITPPAAGATTLAAATYALFTIDLRTKSSVQLWLGNTYLGSVNMANLAATDLLQPAIYIQKDSGTGVPSMTLDAVRYSFVGP